MMTIMGIKVESMRIDLTGTHASFIKHMSATPRRISEVDVMVYMNKNYDSKSRKLLEAAALTCPVAQSLHPETKQNIEFVYPDD